MYKLSMSVLAMVGIPWIYNKEENRKENKVVNRKLIRKRLRKNRVGSCGKTVFRYYVCCTICCKKERKEFRKV